MRGGRAVDHVRIGALAAAVEAQVGIEREIGRIVAASRDSGCKREKRVRDTAVQRDARMSLEVMVSLISADSCCSGVVAAVTSTTCRTSPTSSVRSNRAF